MLFLGPQLNSAITRIILLIISREADKISVHLIRHSLDFCKKFTLRKRTKGQLILRGIFSVFNCSKKRTKTSRLEVSQYCRSNFLFIIQKNSDYQQVLSKLTDLQVSKLKLFRAFVKIHIVPKCCKTYQIDTNYCFLRF